MREVKEGSYPPLKYPYIFTVVKEVIDKGYVNFFGGLEEVFMDGLTNSISNHGPMDPDSRNRLIKHFSGVTNPTGLLLIERIKESIENSFEDELIAKTEAFIKALESSNISEVSNLIRNFNTSYNLFENLCKVYFEGRLVEMKNSGIRLFITTLNERYLRISNANDFYKAEIPFMEEQRDKLLKRQDIIKADPLKKDQIGDVINDIARVIEHVGK
jgi:5'(3')-deoxyribonucleotidase